MSRLDNTKPQTGRERAPRLHELVQMLDLPEKKWVTIRVLPHELLTKRVHWINILAGKDKRKVRIPKVCVSWDPNKEEDDPKRPCPYCELADNQGDRPGYLLNVIVRSIEEDAPTKFNLSSEEKKSGYKQMGSKAFTPVRVWELSSGVFVKLRELADLNEVVVKKDGAKKRVAKNIWDAKYGADIQVKYDKSKTGTDKYQFNIAERRPLSEEEEAYLRWELGEDLLDRIGRESPKQAQEEVKRMEIVGEEEFEAGDDEDDSGFGKKGSKSSKGAGRGRGRDDDDDDDEDEDEDEKPSRKKSPAKSSKRSRDEDDEDDDDEDDEDEKPSRKKPSSKSSKRSRDDDDDDDDEDDDDEDDDEDEKPARKSSRAASSKSSAKSSKSSKRSRDDDDEDDDEDDEDDEDEDEKPSRKKSSAKPTSRSKKSRDDDDDDDDDEDDDEDEKPSRKSSSKSSAKSKKSSKRSRDDDDDDDDDDDIPF